jgi:hypothetical protein
MSYYNEQYGYAFPTKAELALRLNCGINKPAKLAKVLEKYGLIKCVPRYHAQIGSNDIYYVYAPITSAEEFRKTFRQECELYDEKATRLMTRNLKDEAPKGAEVVSEKASELEGWL